MRFLAFSILGLMATSVFAGHGDADKAQTCPPSLRRQIKVYEKFDNDGVNLGMRADVLYMVYQAPVLTYASLQTVSSEILHSHILAVPGQASVGCNLALMYTMPNQPGYTFETSWYHLVAELSRNVNATNIVPAHSATLTLAAPGNASIDAHLTINLFDLLLKKDFCLGGWFCVTPGVGLVGGYLNGVSSAHFVATSGGFSAAGGGNTATTNANLSYTTKFEGMGVKVGTNASFKIWGGFKLTTDFFYSTLYGFSKVKLDYLQNGLSLGGTVRGADANYDHHHARSFFDSLLGLAWESQFNNDSLYLNLHAGWRFQTFLDGWKEFEAEFNDSLQELSFSGQGLQAGATFKF